jgi:uncharacterized protein YndB with AHSA1/START domain
MSDRNEKPKAPAVLRFERKLAHRPEKVWRALVDPRELALWCPTKPRGAVLACDPPHVLAYRAGEDTLRWELTPESDGCRLVLTVEVGSRSAVANDTERNANVNEARACAA